MSFLFEPDEGPPGPAADTGTAVHVAVHAMHRGKSAAECLDTMGTNVRRYPQADLTDAAALFLTYAKDPRNRNTKVLLAEHPIRFQISPAPEDPTQEAIQVIGTLDQVRDDGSGPKLWDVKTSKKDPMELLHLHTFQAAAYCIGASVELDCVVQPGGLILPRRYRPDGSGPAFQHFAWSWKDIPQIMEAVRHAVARVRAGHLYHVPNESCVWCAAKSPDLCLPKLQRTLEELRR